VVDIELPWLLESLAGVRINPLSLYHNTLPGLLEIDLAGGIPDQYFLASVLAVAVGIDPMFVE
jgi:hypothetical protein